MSKITTERENSISRCIFETDEILPLDVNYLPEKFLVECENNCNETPENKIKGLTEIRKLLEADKVTKGIQFQDDFLRQYLRHTKYEAAPAFVKLRNFTNLRTNYNYLYLGVQTEYTVIPSTKYSTVLPHRCPDGSLLFLLQLGKWNPNEMPFEDFARITFLLAIQALRHPLTQIAGMTFIVDFQNTGIRHLKYCTLQNIWLPYHVSLECMPVNYRGNYIINGNFLMKLLWTMTKPILPEQFQKLFIFLSSTEELFNYLPRSIVPSEYGGYLEDYYMTDWLNKAHKQHQRFHKAGEPNFF